MNLRRAIRFAITVFCAVAISSCTVAIKHQRLDELALQPDQGMVVLGIQGNTPFQRIAISGSRRTEVGFDMLKQANPFVVFTLPSGQYRFDRVWLNNMFYVPVIDKSDAGIWDFEVKANHINYLGNIIVTKSSSGGYFLRMHNRSSEALEFLESKYAEKLTELRLRNAIAQDDDFLILVSQLKGYPHD